MKGRLLVFFLIWISSLSGIYGINGDSTQVSLLTVYPRPNEVYTVFGHTALRIYNPSENIDIVFNYGMFDSSRPNFEYHFTRGETDYMLGIDGFEHFKFVYGMENSTVVEQVLNLSSSDIEDMWRMLQENALPENRVYRYNYFFDNCTTRPRDIIEKYCGGQLIYPDQKEPTTFRKLVHECTMNFPWLTFGIDLVIGSGADSLISLRQEMFLPVKLMEAEEEAYVIRDSVGNVPLVGMTRIVMEANDSFEGDNGFRLYPLRTGLILLTLTIIISIIGIFLRRRFRLFFGLIFLAATLAGCLIAFLSFFSTHPCTWPNWNIIWLHPLYIFPFIACFFKKTYKLMKWFHIVNFILLSLFLFLWKVIPQEMNFSFIPYILSLGFISLFHIIPRKR